jgi:uncharacterized membrane protein
MKEKDTKEQLPKRKIILIFLLIIFQIFLFVFLLLGGVNFLISLLINIFLFLFFLGLILKTKNISLKLFKTHEKYVSPVQKTQKDFKTESSKGVKKTALMSSYKRPLIRKCEKCGFILTAYTKKCPNCGHSVQ